MERNRDFGSSTAGANRALQENLDRNEGQIMASYALIGAILLFGAIGYAIDQWANTAPWCLLIGLASGVAFGFARLIVSVRRP